MLQNIRDRLRAYRWLGILVLVALAIIFTMSGAYGIVDLSVGTPNYAVKVNGDEVSLVTVQNAWQTLQSQLQQKRGDDLPAAERQLAQQQLIDSYIDSTLLQQRADSRGMRVDNLTLASSIKADPSFQVDGKYNDAMATAVLAQSGMTPATYAARMRLQMQTELLMQGVVGTDFLTNTELKQLLQLENEQREVRYAVLPLARFEAAVKVNPAQLEAWYNAHQEDYKTVESAHLQYAEMRLDAAAAALKVDDAELTKWYETNKARYVEPEQRKARHILIRVASGADAAATAAAEKKARDVLAKVRAGGDFTALAKEFSEEPGAKVSGGDLGWLGTTAALDKSFSTALFAMKKGETSDLVKSAFGYHIIRLEDVKGGVGKTLADSRALIESDYRKDRASTSFGDNQEKLQQKLEQDRAADFGKLASDFGMQTGDIPSYTHAGAPVLGSNADLTTLVFAPENIKEHRIIGPVALSEDRIIVAKVVEHHPAQLRPLAEVRADVEAAVRRDAAATAAMAAAKAAVTQLQGGADFNTIIKSLNVTAAPAAFVGRGDPQLPVLVRDAVFAMAPVSGKSRFEALKLDSGEPALVQFSGVRTGITGANSANDQQQQLRIVEREQAAEAAAYQLQLRNGASIKRNSTVFSTN